ncbi:MAG: 30S ribosomal protein S9 [Candidatus Magasanikbacteria bacterium]|nr:30S ribosomal protein S9 [Candidatus Magasanikbacteria bacterium]
MADKILKSNKVVKTKAPEKAAVEKAAKKPSVKTVTPKAVAPKGVRVTVIKKSGPKKSVLKAEGQTVVTAPRVVAAAFAEFVGRPFVNAVGRRKEAAARVRVYVGGTGKIVINGRTLEAYFPFWIQQQTVKEALTISGKEGVVDVTAKVAGGGQPAQAEAVRLAIARAIVSTEEGLRKVLKAVGYLRRDPRMKERKKFGLRGARRAPQWAKR